MQRFLARAASLAVLTCLAACTASPYYDHRFQPAPYEVQVASDAVPGSQMRALASVLGIERAKDGVPDRAIVRIRLENLGSVPATFETDSLGLVSADLQSFGTPTVLGEANPALQPGNSGVYDVAFPLPAGKRPRDVDLSGLNLRFTVAYGAHKVTAGASFARSDWQYDEYPRVQVGFGVGLHN
ncbi:MAG: hypothetical protein ACKVXR_16485 [Planctomycetota bacterium]